MTKKELEVLNSARCQINKAVVNRGMGPTQSYIVSFSMTEGQLLTLKHSLENYNSAIAQDLLAFFNNACSKSNIDI